MEIKTNHYPAAYPYARIARQDIEQLKKLIKGQDCHAAIYLYMASRCYYADNTVKVNDTWIPVKKGEYLTTLKDLRRELKLRTDCFARQIDDLIHAKLLTMRVVDMQHIIFRVHGLKTPNVSKNCCGKPSKSGFFMAARAVSETLLALDKRVSIADIYADMLLHGTHMDSSVAGSAYGVVAYLPSVCRDGRANMTYKMLAARYHASVPTISRQINSLCETGYLTAVRLPKKNGSVYFVSQQAIKTEIPIIPVYAVITAYGLDAKRDVSALPARIIKPGTFKDRKRSKKPQETVFAFVDADKQTGICTDLAALPIPVHNHIDDYGLYLGTGPVVYGKEDCRLSGLKRKKLERKFRKAFTYTAQRQPETGRKPLIYILLRTAALPEHYVLREYGAHSYREILVSRKEIK